MRNFNPPRYRRGDVIRAVDFDELSQAVRWLLRRQPDDPLDDEGIIIRAEATSTITARVGTTVGSGTFKKRTRTGTTLTVDEPDLTVYNDFATAIPSGTMILVAHDQGDYMLVSGDCPA